MSEILVPGKGQKGHISKIKALTVKITSCTNIIDLTLLLNISYLR